MKKLISLLLLVTTMTVYSQKNLISSWVTDIEYSNNCTTVVETLHQIQPIEICIPRDFSVIWIDNDPYYVISWEAVNDNLDCIVFELEGRGHKYTAMLHWPARFFKLERLRKCHDGDVTKIYKISQSL